MTDYVVNLSILVVMLLALYFKNYLKTVYLALRLPGPPALPFLGNVLYVKDDNKLVEIAEKFYDLFGPICRVWISVVPFFFVVEPKYLQAVLSTNRNNSKSVFYNYLHNFLGDGLITNSGEKWKQHRKFIQPYFHINVLKVYFDAFQRCSNTLLKKLENHSDLNVVRLANSFVLDVLQASVLGISSKDGCPYRKGTLLMPERIAKPWLLLESIFKKTDLSKKEMEQQEILQSYTRTILEKKRLLKEGDSPINNLIEMMMQISRQNPEFTDEDIVNEACTFMLAGQDSVGAALTFSLYYLAANPKIQEKVLEELRDILKNEDREFTFEDVSEMKYLEQCVKETLRLCPSVPIITRVLTEEVSFGKISFPAGTNLFISPYVTHRLKHVFPDPQKFDPDRFSPENIHKIPPYAFLPFSAGPRNCIGYKFALIELKTVLSKILRTYHISVTPGYEKLNISYKITLKAKKGIWIRLRKRDSLLVD